MYKSNEAGDSWFTETELRQQTGSETMQEDPRWKVCTMLGSTFTKRLSRRRTMYLLTLVSPISIPSLSSSPRIFGAPHSGFSWLIARINSRTSLGTIGRPGLPRLRQCIIVDFRGLDRACLC